MGYDFMLLRLRGAAGPWPLPIPMDLSEDALVPIDDAPLLFEALRADPQVDPASLAPGLRGLRWRTPDGGQLELSASGPAISIDTHAHWDHVAHVLDRALAVWPDVVLFDMQKAHLHDAASLRAFVASSDADLARRNAGRDGGA